MKTSQEIKAIFQELPLGVQNDSLEELSYKGKYYKRQNKKLRPLQGKIL